MSTYSAVSLGAMLLAILMTPLVVRLAHVFHALDLPGLRRTHRFPTPRLGGLLLVVPTFIMLGLVSQLDNVIAQALHAVETKLSVLLGAGLVVFAIGVIDDMRGVRASTKLLVQIAAAACVCAFGIRIASITIAGTTLPLGVFSIPITLLWIVGITNAMNLIDGLDGLAAGIATIACAAITVLALAFHQPVMAVLMLALSGSLAGFLCSNFRPGRLFLGDSGSLFLGFTLGAGSVMCATKSATLVGIALPMLALGVPILDTLFSIFRRTLARRSIFSADHDHIHHRLLAAGLASPWAVGLTCAVTLIVTGIGTMMFITQGIVPLLIFAGAVGLLTIVFCRAGAVRLRSSLRQLRRNLAVRRKKRQQKRCFEEAALLFCKPTHFDSWWTSVCAAAERMDFAKIALASSCSDNHPLQRAWTHPNPQAEHTACIHITVPVPSNGYRLPRVHLACDVPVRDSLELATRQMMLFSRLIEEHGIEHVLSLDSQNVSDDHASQHASIAQYVEQP